MTIGPRRILLKGNLKDRIMSYFNDSITRARSETTLSPDRLKIINLLTPAITSDKLADLPRPAARDSEGLHPDGIALWRSSHASTSKHSKYCIIAVMMRLLTDSLDSLIRAIQLIAQSVAFLFGAHFVVLLHLLHFFTSDPAATLQRQTRPSRDCQQAVNTRARRNEERTRSRVAISTSRYRPPRRFLHLPALEPRPHEDRASDVAKTLLETFPIVFSNLKVRVKDEVQDIGDHLEKRGGKTGKMMMYIRSRSEERLNPSMLHKLPQEIISQILLSAADEVPTKICLLSKTYNRLVMPKLYSRVDIADARMFRHFRMTLAIHNPALGRHVRSLSLASNTFDRSGYLPEGIAEPAALGVGIEQILLASPNLEHLFLDLFALAALYDGTASRLQRGALPISLVTEYAAPQYLALPVFDQLRHVELSVFGLDKTAAEHLRRALPNVKSLTLRWVTRQTELPTLSSGISNASGDAMDEYDDTNEDGWHRGGLMRNDFDSFVEAVNLLRNWQQTPHEATELEEECEPLEAITVLAWPRATLELSKVYLLEEDVRLLSVEEYEGKQHHLAWDKSRDPTIATKPRFDRPSRRPPRVQHRPAMEQQYSSQSVMSIVPKPTPLRLCVDATYPLGPRRGPLESWCSCR